MRGDYHWFFRWRRSSDGTAHKVKMGGLHSPLGSSLAAIEDDSQLDRVWNYKRPLRGDTNFVQAGYEEDMLF